MYVRHGGGAGGSAAGVVKTGVVLLTAIALQSVTWTSSNLLLSWMWTSASALQAGAVWATATVLPLARAVLWEIATWIIWACGWVGSVLQAGAVWATATVLPLFCEIATWIGSNALSLGIAIIQFYVRAWAWVGSKIGAFGALIALLVLVYIHLHVARRVLGRYWDVTDGTVPSTTDSGKTRRPAFALAPLSSYSSSMAQHRPSAIADTGSRWYWVLRERERRERERERQLREQIIVGYHATNASAARSIRANGFQCGRYGLAGGAIYFATSEQDASRKSNNGNNVVLKCQVTLGRTLTLDKDGNSTMTLDKLNGMGYDSVKILRNGDEYVVYEPSRVRVLSVC